jgi:hypothetical protein
MRALLMSHALGNVDHKLKEIMRVLLARFAKDKYFASLRSTKARAGDLLRSRLAEIGWFDRLIAKTFELICIGRSTIVTIFFVPDDQSTLKLLLTDG